jgi:hypothetical protein
MICRIGQIAQMITSMIVANAHTEGVLNSIDAMEFNRMGVCIKSECAHWRLCGKSEDGYCGLAGIPYFER